MMNPLDCQSFIQYLKLFFTFPHCLVFIKAKMEEKNRRTALVKAILPMSYDLSNLKDSKKLMEKKRNILNAANPIPRLLLGQLQKPVPLK